MLQYPNKIPLKRRGGATKRSHYRHPLRYMRDALHVHSLGVYAYKNVSDGVHHFATAYSKPDWTAHSHFAQARGAATRLHDVV